MRATLARSKNNLKRMPTLTWSVVSSSDPIIERLLDSGDNDLAKDASTRALVRDSGANEISSGTAGVVSLMGCWSAARNHQSLFTSTGLYQPASAS